MTDGLFFKLGLCACLLAPSLACNGDGKDSETDATTTLGTTTNQGTTTTPGTTTDDMTTDPTGTGGTTTSSTDPTSTTNGTDPTTGGGNAMFCQEECAGDADCMVMGMDSGLKCIDKRCSSDIPPCTANEQCQALFSGWVTECQDDTACAALQQVCIDIGDPAAGRCATPPSDFIMCDVLMQSEIAAKKFMDGSDVQVCANTSSECHPDGYCFDPCEANTDCENVPGAPMCNVATGACECGSDDDCKNADIPGYAVCNNGVCGCGTDADCAGNDNADKCYDGACGCSDVAACQGPQSFDGTTKVCEGF